MSRYSILETITQAQLVARKERDAPVTSFLSFVIGEARAVGKNKGNRDSTDDEVIAVLRKLIASNEENLTLTKGEDKNAAWQNKILNGFLPTQLSDEDVELLVRSFITGQNWTDEKPSPKWMGDVMSMLKECQTGKYNPKSASEIVRRVLAEYAA
jgi:uncharacterized protein YqeY